MIAGESFLISERPGNDAGRSVNHFIKTKTIAVNHKSIFTKRKSTFAKRKNINYLSGNRFCGNILKEAGNELKNLRKYFEGSWKCFEGRLNKSIDCWK